MVFLVIDGLDVSGKDTQAIRLCSFLGNAAKTVLLRVHPSNDNWFGVKAKEFLHVKGKNAHFASALFYMLDVIRSVVYYSWQKYDYVVFVRYLMGTAYLPSPLHRITYHFFALIVPTSKLMFFLDVTPEEAYRRIQQRRRRQEVFEGLEELRRVRCKALSLAITAEWRIIDADKKVEEIAKQISKSALL